LEHTAYAGSCGRDHRPPPGNRKNVVVWSFVFLHAWTEAEIARFGATHPNGGQARLALGLGIFTAHRSSDVTRTGWQHTRNGLIRITRQKPAQRY